MKKIIILSKSKYGTASFHLNSLITSKQYKISMVVYNKNKINMKKYYIRKIRKMFKIGFLGSLNGIRMRKWYDLNKSLNLNLKSLKEVCFENKIKYIEVSTINSQSTKELLEKEKPDLGISLGNSYITSKIFDIPKYGMINVHHEILPEYKGAQSVLWQIYNKSNKTGYSIHEITNKIDGGKILFQEDVCIDFKNNLRGTIIFNYYKLWNLSTKSLAEVLENYEFYNSKAINQSKSGKRYSTPSIFKFIKILFNHSRLKK